jgi:hypothetical protein
VKIGWFIAALVVAGSARAEEKKEEKKPALPTIVCVAPLAVRPGGSRAIKIRGMGLAEATAIKLVDAPAGVTVEIKGKAKSEAKPFDPAKVGDSQVDAVVKLPTTMPAGKLAVVIVTAAGESKPMSLLVEPSLVEEKEPNNGFRNAQEIATGKMISGAIGEANDVDVFRFSGKRGEKLTVAVTAAALGSPLDGLLTVYDERGHVLAGNDDAEGSSDPVVHFVVSGDGVYFVSLTDANERGHGVCAYLLVMSGR